MKARVSRYVRLKETHFLLRRGRGFLRVIGELTQLREKKGTGVVYSGNKGRKIVKLI